MSTFAIATLGCKVNSYESESYVHDLIELGYHEIDFKEEADIYIINTCAVTNSASSKSRQKMNQAKKRNSSAIVCLVGCFVQTDKTANELGVDVLIGSSHKQELANIVHTAFLTRKKQVYIKDVEEIKTFEHINVDHFEHKTRAFLKIQDGCNQFCSYCIIPYARGRERSMPLASVIENAEKLVAYNHKEIVLTGIHIGRYGKDIGTSLLLLLRKLIQIKGLERIRISSIEMNEVTSELILFMKEEKKMAHHLHIPLQSGCNRILKQMRRPYNVELFKLKIDEIRKEIPNISISSDLILGFPDEHEEDFGDTIETLELLKFSFIHIFPFSKRDGTIASTLVNQLPNTIKKERCSIASSLSKKQYEDYINTFVGNYVNVLFEKDNEGYLSGHSDEYIEIKVQSVNNNLLNTIQSVKIIERVENQLIGKLEDVS